MYSYVIRDHKTPTFNNVVGGLLNTRVKVIYLIVVKVNEACWEDSQENNEREHPRDQNHGTAELVKRDTLHPPMDKPLESRSRLVSG